MKRVVVYMPQELHHKLKAKCALSGTSVSEWFRQGAKKFIESYDEEPIEEEEKEYDMGEERNKEFFT